MIKSIITRVQQGHRTIAYPAGPPPELPGRFRGRPLFDTVKCPDACQKCADACPTQAIAIADGKMKLDLGRCLFCTDAPMPVPKKRLPIHAIIG